MSREIRNSIFSLSEGTASSGQSWSSYWNTRKQANYFVDGFDGAKILDSSGNGLDAISRNTGSFVGDGTAYFTVTGLLTTDVITALSTDKPTCTTNDKLEIANTEVVYGITITRSGSVWAYYPVVEKTGVCLHDVSGNGNHGYMVSGSDSNWAVIDSPTYDYLRDYGCSKVVNYDGVLKLRVRNQLLVGSLASDSWKIAFNFKIDELSDGYLLFGSGYIRRVSSTILRYRTNSNSTSLDFVFSEGIPLVGSFLLEHNGSGKYECTISDTTVVINTTAYKLDYLNQWGWMTNPPNKGYFRDFQFTLNDVLILDVPDFISGWCNVRNQKVLDVYAGTMSFLYIPAQQESSIDADGFELTHSQTGSLAIPGTYFSLPEDATLIAACDKITSNVYFTEGSANIIAVSDITHYEPKQQYYDWSERENLIIVKDDVTITDVEDLRKIKELHYWGTCIAEDFASINSHFSDEEKEYYSGVIETLLSPSYVDDATTGYYYSTFGPEGLKRENCGFFMLFFHEADIKASTNVPFNSAYLTVTPRINVGGNVVDSCAFSDHIFNGNEYLMLSSSDNFQESKAFYYRKLLVRLNTILCKRQIPCLDRITNAGSLYISGYLINIDITNYSIANSEFLLVPASTQCYGALPAPNSIFTGVTIDLSNTGVTKFGFTEITNNIGIIKLDYCPILSSEMDRLFSMLNTAFTANAPTKELIVRYCYWPTGYLTDGDNNADKLALEAIFSAAGQSLTLTSNGTMPITTGDAVLVLTHDDFFKCVMALKEDYKARGIKPTAYGTTKYITAEKVYEIDSWGPVVSWAECRDLKDNYDWDLECHGHYHSLTAPGADDKAAAADADWIAHGFLAPRHSAYPAGNYTDESIAELCPVYRDSARRVMFGFNGLDTPPMELNGCELDAGGGFCNYKDLTKLKYSMDVLAESKLCMILLLHGFSGVDGRVQRYDPTYDEWLAIIDYAISKGIKIKSHKEYYDEYIKPYLDSL